MTTPTELPTWAKIGMWLAAPLLTLVFAAGGGWYLLSSLSGDLDTLARKCEAHMEADAAIGAARRLDTLEEHQADTDRRYEKINENVIAICVATKATCK